MPTPLSSTVMQQQGVIITAVALALILAGALWYAIARDAGDKSPATVIPTPTVQEPPPPTPEPVSTQPSLPEVLPPSTAKPSDVAPTATLGAAENMVALLVAITAVSGWQLVRLRRAAVNTLR